jgi:hypothetical protein
VEGFPSADDLRDQLIAKLAVLFYLERDFEADPTKGLVQPASKFANELHMGVREWALQSSNIRHPATAPWQAAREALKTDANAELPTDAASPRRRLT